MQTIIFHSDDYGMSVESSKYILNCCDHGVLNSVAIMANSPAFDECCDLLAPYVDAKKINISVHLNLVEGRSLSPAQSLSILTNDKGYFHHSFESLLLLSLSSKRKQLKDEIKQELFLQIQKISQRFPEISLALDSHQHFHMIPLVFQAVMEIIQEHQMTVRYVRMSSEPIMPILCTPAVYRQIRPINIIKNLLLNMFGWKNRPLLHRYNINTNLFWGLMFSGDMNYTVVSSLLSKFQKIACKQELPLEVLSHPCPITDLCDCLDPSKKEFVSFYFSSGRHHEIEMLKHISTVFSNETI